MAVIRKIFVVAVGLLVVAACGDDGAGEGGAGNGARPSVVVTTTILGDVVSSMVGDAATVTTIMPVGASPHDFQASARQVAAMREADLLVVNGGGFEEGLLDVIEGAEGDGVAVYEAISAVEPLGAAGPDGHDEDEDDGRDGDDHDHSGGDPHFFTDPNRMAAAARGIYAELVVQVPALGADDVRSRAEAYVAQLDALDAEIAARVEAVPPSARVLVTNHGVLGYFAERYGFEVAGTVIPAGTTTEGASAADLAALADTIEAAGVRAIFTDTSSPDDLARTLAGEVGDVEVVELFTESLGDDDSGAATYVDMMRTNAERIVGALS